MGRELKRDQAPRHAAGDARSGLSAPGIALTLEASREARSGRRWFEALDARAPAPAVRPKSYLGMALFVLALVLFALAKGIVLRVLLPLALAAGAVALVLRSRRRSPAPSARQRGLALDRQRRTFDDGRTHEGPSAAPHPLLSTATPFGVTLVTTRRRDRLVAALSSGSGTFYVGATFDAAARRAFAPLLARAGAASADEGGLDAAGPDGEPIDLAPADLAALVEGLTAIDGACLDRFVLSDAHGEPLMLDGYELRVADHRFDLSAPLEWRAFVFQEPFGQAVAVYQATSIRQGSAEVVLISLLPSLVPSSSGELVSTGIAELDRASIRDLRLTQAAPDEPPPTEQRVAIDRLFMLPLRIALDRAPRASQQPTRARA